MKIAIVSPGCFSVPPVIGSSVEHDIQMIAQQMAKEHEVYVYTRICPEYTKSTKHAKLRYIRFRFYNYEQYVLKAARHIKRKKPDIVVVENRPSYVKRIKAFVPNVPIVLNMHSKVYALPPVIERREMVDVSRRVDALLTNSDYLKKFYMSRFPKFRDKAFSVHLGINSDPFEQAQNRQERIATIKRKFKIKDGDQTILFVGRLLREKGIHLLLDVFPQLKKEFPRLKLIITGSPVYGRSVDTPYVKLLRRKANKFKNDVIFTHFVKPHNIPYIYQLADVVVIPSLWQEPFGRVNLEAMAATKPVVASNRGGIPEVVKNDVNGWIFSVKNYRTELYQAVRELLHSEELREEFGRRGFETAKQFSWAKTAEGYIQVFKNLLPDKENNRQEIRVTSGGDAPDEGTDTVCGERNETAAVFLLSAEDAVASSE